MASYFTLSFRFLAPTFHGRRDGGQSEWPPSPMRAFEAMVAATFARARAEALAPRTRSAFEWLERQAPPILIAPASSEASGYRLSVPNNAMDIVARAWTRGNYSNAGDANPATHRTLKGIRPTLLLSGNAVHFLWSVDAPIADDVRGYIETLREISRDAMALGWGIDLAIGHGAILSPDQAETLTGEWWLPHDVAEGDGLRAPTRGSLDDLIYRHQQSMSRLGPEGLHPPPPLRAYRTVGYRRATDPPARPFAVFSLLKPDASGFRPFDTARRGLTVAGMLRHAAKMAAASSGWAVAEINSVILGHGEADDGSPHVPVQARFAYLPLPTIEPRGEGRASVIGAIRRVMISAFALQQSDRIGWARRTLSGQELIEERAGDDRSVAILSLLPQSDSVVRRYINSAATWSTVTPVVLPGYDDPAHYRRRMSQPIAAAEQKTLLARLADRIDRLLRKAIVQAGFPSVLAENAILEWRETGFWPGVDRVDRYGVPDHLQRFPRLHVRVQWRDTHQRPLNIPGPICLGGGRFYGLGLFAAL